ncbi:MAG: DoxX family protein [Planctomycetes bacterium]|nr:DoxX family protein [Planctomycetota bacterium]
MLKAVLSPFTEKSYALLRIVSGALLAFAGLQKLFGVMMPYPRPAIGSQIWIGALIELVGGAAITLGLFTRCAAFVCSGTMAVAYWQFHVFQSQVQGAGRFIPNVNQGIPAAVLCFVYLYIACKGAGVWSVDAKREAAAK